MGHSSYDGLVLAGGGCRCFWQMGFLEVLARETDFRPREVGAVSAGSSMASAFFAGWNGHAVSVRPTKNDKPSVDQVLIVNDDNSRTEQTLEADAIDGLMLPFDALALPPTDVSERPLTRKFPYTLQYEIKKPTGEVVEGEENPVLSWHVYPTTSPRAVAMAVLLWIVAFGLRNMIVAGSPIHVAPREREPVKLQQRAGSVASPVSRSKKGPPPGKRQKGRRRR